MTIKEISVKTKSVSTRDWTKKEKKAHEDGVLQDNENAEEIKIKSLLFNIDLKSIRALRAGDTEYIAKLEDEAVELRKKLK